MNTLIAGLIAGFCGLLQLFAIMMIEMQNDEEKSGILSSDTVFPIFALLVMAEIMCVMSLSMYRIAPWLLRVSGEKWEADRISAARSRYGAFLQRTTVIAPFARRILVMADAGAFSSSLALSLAVALAAFLVPRPKI